MKRIYIAGKIGQLEKKVFEANFEKGKSDVINLGLGAVPVSPVDLPHEHERTWEAYMKEDLRELLTCDAVYALNNWEDSPGATIEVKTALSVKIPVIYQPIETGGPIRIEGHTCSVASMIHLYLS